MTISLVNNPFFKKIGIFLVCFCIMLLLKLPVLGMPYNGDEADCFAFGALTLSESSFFPWLMAETGMLGHPPIFFELVALSFKLFGPYPFAARLACLIPAAATLFILVIFGKQLHGWLTGLSASILLLTCPLFFAQSSLIYPEVTLGFFLITAIYGLFMRKWTLYIIAASLMCLTKEPGLVLLVAFATFMCVRNLADKSWRWRDFLFLISPVGAFMFWIMGNLLFQGWFLYPDHVNFLSFANFATLLQEYAYILMVRDHRWICFILIFLGLYFYRKLTPMLKSIFMLLGTLIIFYLPFYAMSFLDVRYMTVLLPVLYLAVGGFLSLLIKNKWIILAIVVLITSLSIYEWWPGDAESATKENDYVGTNLNYVKENRLMKWAAEQIESKADNGPILTENWQYLTFIYPSAGFTTSKIEVESVNIGRRRIDLENLVPEIIDLCKYKAIIIYSHATYGVLLNLLEDLSLNGMYTIAYKSMGARWMSIVRFSPVKSGKAKSGLYIVVGPRSHYAENLFYLVQITPSEHYFHILVRLFGEANGAEDNDIVINPFVGLVNNSGKMIHRLNVVDGQLRFTRKDHRTNDLTFKVSMKEAIEKHFQLQVGFDKYIDLSHPDAIGHPWIRNVVDLNVLAVSKKM
jgi:hypothetical protein